MNADFIEFHSTVKDGVIEIPEEYRDRIKGNIRVIVYVEISADKSLGEETNAVQQLLEHPISIPGFRPLTRDEIYSDGT